MTFFLLGALTAVAALTSGALPDSVETVTSTRPCSQVFVYTSDSQTFVVTDLGSVADGSYCASTSHSTPTWNPFTHDVPRHTTASSAIGLSYPTSSAFDNHGPEELSSRQFATCAGPTTVTATLLTSNTWSTAPTCPSAPTVTSYISGSGYSCPACSSSTAIIEATLAGTSCVETITLVPPAMTTYIYRSTTANDGYEDTGSSVGSAISSFSMQFGTNILSGSVADTANGLSVATATVTSYIYRPAPEPSQNFASASLSTVTITMSNYTLACDASNPSIEAPSTLKSSIPPALQTTNLASQTSTPSDVGSSSLSFATLSTPPVYATPVTANATALQQQGTSSNSFVTAQVVNAQENPPVAPPPGVTEENFLLVTFGTATTSSAVSAYGDGVRRRQLQQPLVYNTTQTFSAIAGDVYNLSANAAAAQNGDTPPSCTLTICGGDSCGIPDSIGTAFRQYYYLYQAVQDQSSEVATFSIQCAGNAYVGLSNVTVTPVSATQPSTAALQSTSNASSRPIAPQTVTTSILSTVYLTATVFATQTETTQNLGTSVSGLLQPTTIVSTAYATATSLQNVTQELTQTSTTTLTTTLLINQTLTTSLVISTILYQTVTATTNAYVTYTTSAPARTLTQTFGDSIVTSFLPASTYVTTELFTTSLISTQYLTTTEQLNGTQQAETIFITTLAPASTQTVFVTSPVLANASTETIYITTEGGLRTLTTRLEGPTQSLVGTTYLPGGTTVLYSTIFELSTLPASTLITTQLVTLYSTLVTYGVSNLPGPTDVQYLTTQLPPETTQVLITYTTTLVSTLPQGTTTILSEIVRTSYSQLPASTVVYTSTLLSQLPAETNFVTFTSVQPAETITLYSTIVSNLPRGTTTIVSAQLSTLEASTIYVTSTLPRQTEVTQLPAETSYITYTFLSTILSTIDQGTTTLVSTEISTLLSYFPASTLEVTLTEARATEATSLAPIYVTQTSVREVTYTTSLAGQVRTSVFLSTIFITTTLPRATATTNLPAETTSLPPIYVTQTSVREITYTTSLQGQITTSTYFSTVLVTTTLPRATATATAAATTSFPVETTSLPPIYVTQTSIREITYTTSLQGQITTSVSFSTVYITTTLPRETATTPSIVVYTTTAPAQTSILVSYAPQATTTRIETLSASTYVVTSYQPVTYTTTLPGQNSTILLTSTQPARTETIYSQLPQGTTTLLSTISASTVVNTEYTTLPASTVTRVVYSTVETTNVVTQYSTLPASSIYVTYTTTAQGQLQTVTLTYTPTTQTPEATSLFASPVQTLITTTLQSTSRTSSMTSIAGIGLSTSTTSSSTTSRAVVTTTTTTTRSTSTSSSISRPAVALRAPTVIAGSPTSAPSNIDDAVYTVNLPSAISMMGVSATRVYVSSNGIVAVTSPLTTAYSNAALPQYSVAANGLFAFWDDLFITQGTNQGIFYAYDGSGVNAALTFEFYMSKYQASTTYSHFLVAFWANWPSSVTVAYLNMTDAGGSATVGIQSQALSRYLQYSSNTAVIPNGLVITYNYTSNVWQSGYPPGVTGIPGAIY